MTDAIRIDHVSKKFGKQNVLNNVSFRVHQGEIFGLIGLNGVGKTTLIKIMLDLLLADDGAIKFFGKNTRLPESRKKIAYLPEKFYPSPFLKGFEFLSLSLSHYGKAYDPKRAAEIAQIMDLNPLALSKKVSKYSKGMGQKLGLMSVFLSDVPLLVLDEPMSGLDPRARIQLKMLLKEYVSQGNSIFFSSHILSDIDEICDRIAVMDNGDILFVGTPAEFKKHYRQDVLEKAFLEAINKGMLAA